MQTKIIINFFIKQTSAYGKKTEKSNTQKKSEIMKKNY